MVDCKYAADCQNSDKCFVCTDYRLLKLPGDKRKQTLQSKARIATTSKDNLDDSSESWKSLEESVAAELNALLTTKQYKQIRESRRQVRSGAIWFMPGDVSDTVVLAECKERSSVTAKGEKTITIPKEWLTKVAEEARMGGQYPTLMFRYKNDETIYSVNDFDVLCEMVHEIKYLRVENERLSEENDTLRLEIKKLLSEKRKGDF